MPNPLDLLRKAGSAAITPLVPQRAIQPMQDAIDSPSLDRSPNMARLQGFGAGALEGLRGLSSPLDLAGMAVGGGGLAVLRGLGRAVQRAAPTIDLIEDAPIQQVMPGMDDVDALIGEMRRNLAKVPQAKAQRIETLGENAREFTPVGGEGVYNAGQALPPSNPLDHYLELLRRMGGKGR